MRVVQTNKAYYPVIGGIETIVANLSEGLRQLKGVDVEVLVCNDRTSPRTTHDVINGVPVTYASTLLKIASLPISMTYSQVLSKLEGDILHIHEPFPLADLSVMTKPSIRNHFAKIVISWHSDIVRQRKFMGPYTPLLEKFLDQADRIIVATPHHIATSPFLRVREAKCEVIPYGIKFNGVDSDHDADLVRSIRKTYGSPLILFVGRLVYYKGVQYLIDAMRRIENGHLLIVGSGPLGHQIQKQILQNDLSKKISIISHVRGDELFSYFKACDAFVLPSTESSEAFGIVLVEAMACGKPVVSTNLKTGVTYINRNELTGLTVPVRDSVALADAIQRILNDQTLANTLGRNGKERVLNEFTVESMVNKTYEMYRQLLSR